MEPELNTPILDDVKQKVVAHVEEGISFYKKKQWADAQDCFRRAVELEPNYREGYSKIADTYVWLNEPGLAVEIMVNALEHFYYPGYLVSEFIFLLERLNLVAYVPALDAVLQRCYQTPGQEYQRLNKLVRQQLNMKYPTELMMFLTGEKSFQALSMTNDPLFHALFRKSINIDQEWERVLQKLRRDVSECSNYTPSAIKLAVTLSHQNFLNEYVIPYSPEEKERWEQARARLETVGLEGQGFKDLLCVALYAPLRDRRQLEKWQSQMGDTEMVGLLERLMVAAEEKHPSGEGFLSLRPIENSTSQKVQKQYEENPYPRWDSLSSYQDQNPADLFLGGLDLKLPSWMNEPDSFRVLVAGCGTGRHAIEAALRFPQAHVLGIDLSSASLRYAQRKSQELGIPNIEWLQGDLLDVGLCGKKFHWIECSGVLHHMHAPTDGLRALVNVMEPEGVLLLGLYSTRARQAIQEARTWLQERKLGFTEDNVRMLREEIIRRPDHPLRAVMHWRDFYNMSECRDLLFHVQEHTFTPLQIQSLLNEAGLTLVRFVMNDLRSFHQYAEVFPQDPSMNNLELWDQFEQQHPFQFCEMYQFFCQKLSHT